MATKQAGLEPGGLQDLGHTTLQEQVYKTKIKDVHELREHTVDEWDKLDQRFINKAFREWRKRLRACVVAGEGQFEHKMRTCLIADVSSCVIFDCLLVD